MYIILEAGLGNQLFEVFALLSKAIDINELDKIKINNIIKNPHDIISKSVYWNTLFIKLKPFLTDTRPLNINKIYKEKQMNIYNEIPNDIDMIQGYFQSLKYFDKNWNKLKNYLTFSKNINIKINKQTVSIHFRLGDYIISGDNHPVLPVEYYIKSLNVLTLKLNKKIEDLYFIIFIEKNVKNNIEEMEKRYNELFELFKNNNVHYKYSFNIDNIETDIDDLQLMSKCNHNIIANSTFSWWGAYINENLNKIVIYPSLWFKGSLTNIDVSELFKDDWIKINI